MRSAEDREKNEGQMPKARGSECVAVHVSQLKKKERREEKEERERECEFAKLRGERVGRGWREKKKGTSNQSRFAIEGEGCSLIYFASVTF